MIILAFLIPVGAMVLLGALIKNEGTYFLPIKWNNINKIRLLWEETYIGASYGFTAGIILRSLLLALILGVICGILWAWGGAENTSKNWRRWGVGSIIAFAGLSATIWAILVIFTTRFSTGLGYGMPCPSDPKPSIIGKFWMDLLKNEFKATIMTRLTIGILLSLSLLPLLCHR